MKLTEFSSEKEILEIEWIKKLTLIRLGWGTEHKDITGNSGRKNKVLNWWDGGEYKFGKLCFKRKKFDGLESQNASLIIEEKAEEIL